MEGLCHRYAGNETESTGQVTVDTTIPAFSEDTGLDAASDVGDSNSDNLSNQTQPSFKGTTEPGAKVTLTMTINGDQVVTHAVTAGADGSFIITVPSGQALTTDGQYDWVLTSEDAAGNTSTDMGQYTLDTRPPDVDFSLKGDTGG